MQVEIILIIDIKILMKKWILKRIRRLKRFYLIHKARILNKKVEAYLD
jgi:hypothetical protein